ncbi:NO-inducible flavohemoprotein [Chryseobacterium sp. MYb7]|uniref:NO-inducible flavohemoprotein n=1 Tax=Chryseobacterium sp. MYb7 TaxID=1827290 RepID=UPI000D004946|nr:NO-inducible flavohemoprotein [Chryseobacterium sp. MYb7]PRA94097.1 NO-inducible flavohemoprotein [Chryseobacterium sp. MYb7]
MTSEQKQLVKDTVPVLKEHGVLLTSHFYARMFQYNPELKNIFNMGNQQNSKQQTALAMAVLMYAEHIEDPSVLLPMVDGIGQKHTSLDIRPEHYDIVGRHLIASIKEVLGLAASVELLDAWTVAYNQLASLMSGREKELYKKHTEQKGGWSGWRPFVVKQKVVESTEITSFYLYPADGGSVKSHLPGQYISLRLFLPELQLLQPRQYSISCKSNSEYYRISVKKEVGSKHPDGMISNRLHNHITEGSIVELSAPAGTFILNESTLAHKVFISGGVGQTPLLSMIENLTNEADENKVSITWIHGCRNEAVHAFKDKITELSNFYSNINQHVFYEQSNELQKNKYKGWVDLEVLKETVLDHKAEYYICGPALFIKKHYNFLVENGVQKSAIYFEEFGPASLHLN